MTTEVVADPPPAMLTNVADAVFATMETELDDPPPEDVPVEPPCLTVVVPPVWGSNGSTRNLGDSFPSNCRNESGSAPTGGSGHRMFGLLIEPPNLPV